MRDEAGDAELLQAIGNADSAAFSILARRYARRCYGLAYRILGNREMAEDTVQEVMLKIWTKPFTWQPDRGAKFSTWLYRVVFNAAIDTHRRFNTAPATSLEKMKIEPAKHADDMTRDLTRVCAALNQAIAALPTHQRLAIILCRLEKMSYAEAGEILGVSAKAVDGYINRGVRTLKKDLGQRGMDVVEILKDEQ